MSEVEGFVKDLSVGELVIWSKGKTSKLMGKMDNAVRAGLLIKYADRYSCFKYFFINSTVVRGYSPSNSMASM